MKKIKKENLRRMGKYSKYNYIAETSLKDINTWAVPLLRYSRPFLQWTRKKFNKWRQRKLLTKHKALRHRDDIDGLYVSRKLGRGALVNIEESVESILRYNDSEITQKRAKSEFLLRPERTQTPERSAKQQKLKKSKIGRNTNLWIFHGEYTDCA